MYAYGRYHTYNMTNTWQYLTSVDRHNAMSKYVSRLYQKGHIVVSSIIYTILYHWGVFYVDSLSLLFSLSSPFSLSFSPPFLSSLFLSPLSSPPPCVFLPPGLAQLDEGERGSNKWQNNNNNKPHHITSHHLLPHHTYTSSFTVDTNRLYRVHARILYQ